MNLKVICLPAFADNYIWLIIDESNHQAICIDPGDAKPVLDYLHSHQLNLSHILITHHHFDHINGVSDLKKTYSTAKIIGPNDNRIAHCDIITTSKQEIKLDSYPLQLQCLETPGHTSSHVCYYFPKQKWLFCGDTLFSAGCGRLFEGSASQMHASLSSLAELPEDTQIFCAHEYTLSNLRFAATIEPHNTAIKKHITTLTHNPTKPSLPSTLALEKKINPFLRCHYPNVIEYASKHGAKDNSPEEIFATIRHQKDIF